MGKGVLALRLWIQFEDWWARWVRWSLLHCKKNENYMLDNLEWALL